jgi:hypothetical protein
MRIMQCDKDALPEYTVAAAVSNRCCVPKQWVQWALQQVLLQQLNTFETLLYFNRLYVQHVRQ